MSSDVRVLPGSEGDAGHGAIPPGDPHPFLRLVPLPDPEMGGTRAPSSIPLSIDHLEESHLAKVAAATRYLYRCRLAGDMRPTVALLREVISEADASDLEAAIDRFFEESHS